MRIVYLVGVTCISFVLASCATQPCCSTTQMASNSVSEVTPHKDPINVSFYNEKKKIVRPYQIMGKATVSKYNLAGIKRQEATVKNIMRNLAASLDGDAVIDIKHDAKSFSGTVVAYKKVLL